KTGVFQRYHNPSVQAVNAVQELAQTHDQVSVRKVRVQHSSMTHYLPLHFPEADRYYTISRAQWFTRLLHRFPCPAAITRYSREACEQEAWTIVGRKVNTHGFLHDDTSSQSVGLPVSEDSEAIQMFRVILAEQQSLCATRAAIEQPADQARRTHPDYQRLRTLPGVGPILALTILAEAGDLRRFPRHRQFVKFCGLVLSTQQAGQFRASRLSKHGNAGCARLSGWRHRAWCGCVKIRSDRNMPGTSSAIRRTLIASARPSAPWPPQWRASRMGLSRRGLTIGRTVRQSHPVEHSVRLGRRGRY
ncbi:MAG: IS110 family transposase, partial [Nitrospirota bacterium]|nr:IS110 family transposase [Nitrospirota bacterium]